MEAADLLIGLLPGIGLGAVLVFALTRSGSKTGARGESASKQVMASERTIHREELDKGRSDYKTLRLEKELFAGALTRVYEAEAKGKISKAEREILSAKYRDQIKAIDAKIADTELLVEVGELESLRNELVNLLETKISQINRRLDEAKTRLEQIRGPPTIIIEDKPSQEQVEEKKGEKPKPVKKEPAVDEKVRDIRNEVLEALARLEQMDVEG